MQHQHKLLTCCLDPKGAFVSSVISSPSSTPSPEVGCGGQRSNWEWISYWPGPGTACELRGREGEERRGGRRGEEGWDGGGRRGKGSGGGRRRGGKGEGKRREEGKGRVKRKRGRGRGREEKKGSSELEKRGRGKGDGKRRTGKGKVILQVQLWPHPNRTPNRTAASNDQCQACVAGTRSHPCILVIRTHTETIYSSNCGQAISRSWEWEWHVWLYQTPTTKTVRTFFSSILEISSW